MSNLFDKPRQLLSDLGVDGLFVCSPTNRRYLTGYTAGDHAPDELSGIVLLGKDAIRLYTSPVNAGWAAAEATGADVRPWQRPWESFITREIADLGWQRVGFEDRGLVVNSFEQMRAAAPKLAWKPIGEAFDLIRATKTEPELDALATAIRLTDEVFTEVAATMRPGDTEAEIGWRIERLSREQGAEVGFHPIVASGPNAAKPHHAVTNRRLEPGEPIIIDMGVAWKGYSGDLTRTVWFGDAPARLREIYDVVYHAHTAAIDMIAAGVRAKDVDQRAREIIVGAGYGDNFVHSLGHGLGLRVHELPSLSAQSDALLQPGHVVTVEPGIYLPGWGGVRIEDVVVVTEDGCKDLTAASKIGGLTR